MKTIKNHFSFLFVLSIIITSFVVFNKVEAIDLIITASTPTTIPSGTSVTFTPNIPGSWIHWKVNGVEMLSRMSQLGTNFTYYPANGDVVTLVTDTYPGPVIRTSNAITMTVTTTPCDGIPTVSHGGKTYNTVKIGTQCWLKENLDIGTKILGVQNQENNNIIEKYCLNNEDAKCAIYGGLYNWSEAVQYQNGATNTTNWNPVPTTPVQGICPAGWHIPKNSEFSTLFTYLGGPGLAGAKMKEAGLVHWNYPNVGATNSSGFNALGSGYRWTNGTFNFANKYESWWTVSPGYSPLTDVYYAGSSYATADARGGQFYKTNATSVRCIKDEGLVASVSIQSNPTPAIAGSITFTATPVNAGSTPVYQWKKNGTNINGATNSTYTGTLVSGDTVVVVMNSNITSNAITVGVLTTVPDAPTNLIGNFNTSSSADLTWTAPSNNGGSPITSYEIQYRHLAYPNVWYTVTSTTTSKTITGLWGGSKYEYKVSAVNAVGTGPSILITAPGKVTGLIATPEGPGKVLLTWTTPSNGGSPLDHFRIRHKATDVTPIPNNWGTFLKLDDPNATSTYIIGLTTGKTYEFKIRAWGSSAGEWSDLASTTVALTPSSSLIAGVGNALGENIGTAEEVKLIDTFTTSLSYNKKHAEVRKLQEFLNNSGYVVAINGAGSVGSETEYFGKATQKALMKFQKDKNVNPASGNFGPITRALINQIIKGNM